MAIEKGWNLTDLAEKLGQSRANLNNKLTKETLRYKELQELAEVLEKTLEWTDKKK